MLLFCGLGYNDYCRLITAHAHAATNDGSKMQEKKIDTGTNENSNEKAANIFANNLFELNAKHVWKLLIIVIECIEQAAKRLVNCSAASALGGAGDADKATIPSGNNAEVWIEVIAHIYSLVFALFERVCDAVGQQLSAIAPRIEKLCRALDLVLSLSSNVLCLLPLSKQSTTSLPNLQYFLTTANVFSVIGYLDTLKQSSKAARDAVRFVHDEQNGQKQTIAASAATTAEQLTALFKLQTWSETLSKSGARTDDAVSKQDPPRETSLNDDAKQRSLQFVSDTAECCEYFHAEATSRLESRKDLNDGGDKCELLTLSSSRSRRLIPRWYRTRWQLACLLTFVFSTFLIPCLHAADRDFYGILGVPKTATTNQIKKAYRKLAGKIHPDVNKGDLQAEQKFHDLAAAYETLSDDDKRQKYDQFGEEGLKQMGGSPFGGDPFSSFFGDFFNFGHQQRGEGGHHGQQTPRGADIEMDLDVTLEELYNSEFVEIVRNKPIARPAPGTRKCNCRQEMVTRQVSHNSFQMIQTQVCDECPNIKWDTEERILEVEIEQGMTDGQSQIFVGEGEPHVDGNAGDLRVIMRTLPHARFERRGDDLYTNVSISLQQALAGFEISLKHLDEHLVPIKREGITPPGARMRKKNEGMLNYEDSGRFGDLILTFDVKFPATNTANVFNEEQKQVLAQLLKQDSVEAIVYNGLRYNSPR